MASRTQLRLDQITASYGDSPGKIIDTKNPGAATTLATIPVVSGSMIDITLAGPHDILCVVVAEHVSTA